ncbi:MAG: DUF3606 domain-containing protein [Dongiaceae bacterium]
MAAKPTVLRADAPRIDINEPSDIRRWSKRLKVSPDRLLLAVARAGSAVSDVERHLKQPATEA